MAALAPERGWPLPGYRTVTALVRSLDPALRTLAHAGAAAYREEFDLRYRRQAATPNALWQADHTWLDIWVTDARGHPVRPWLTVILDDYSRAVAGTRLSTTAPSARHTALTLRDAIWRKSDPRWHLCGIPAQFYTDHGTDFTSHHLAQVAADLKMELIFSTVGRPRGRGRIERFFQTVNQLFLSTLPGYLAPGAPRRAPKLTLAELDQRWRAFVLEDYHQRRHHDTGMAPQARWDAGGLLPRLPESLDQLDLLLLTEAKPRRVQQDGIHFQGLRYLDLNLAAYVGETVLIRYDPQDVTEIRVYHDDQFVCRAVCQDLASHTIGLPDIVRARRQRRRQVGTDLKDRRSLLEQLLAVPDSDPSTARTEPVTAPEAPDTSRPFRLKRYHDD